MTLCSAQGFHSLQEGGEVASSSEVDRDAMEALEDFTLALTDRIVIPNSVNMH